MMPEISRFLGIVIEMPIKEHVQPHFSAMYNEHALLMNIENGAVIEGSLPPRAFGYVHEWRARHVEELLENWQRANRGASLITIEPLE